MTDVCSEYGAALLELTVEEGTSTAIFNEIRAIRPLFEQNERYLKLLSSPNIAKTERIRLIDGAFPSIHKTLRNFMKLMVEQGYTTFLIGSLQAFERLYYEEKEIVIAEVESVTALTEHQKAALQQKLENMTNKQVELRFTISPKMIGGLRMKIDGKVYDGSISARLEKIGKNLAGLTIGKEGDKA